MKLKLFKTAQELWQVMEPEILEYEGRLAWKMEYSNPFPVESLEDLGDVSFPVVVRTTTNYDDPIPNYHLILPPEEVERLHQEMVLQVLNPYFELLKEKALK